MPSRFAHVTLVALLALAARCSDATPPVAPTATPPQASPPQAPATPPTNACGLPGLPPTDQVYASTAALDEEYARNHLSTPTSRFVLHADCTFALQFVNGGYVGRYTVSDQVTFEWDGWSTAGPWGATGTLRGDTLHVEYNIVMQLSDFIDGDYVRVSAAP